MPSFTLEPFGADKSTINRHFPGWWGFGITPKRLTCTLSLSASGPTTLPSPHSFARYCSTISALSSADRMLREALLSRTLPCPKPSRKPWRIPCKRYSTNVRFGWDCKRLDHASGFSGVLTLGDAAAEVSLQDEQVSAPIMQGGGPYRYNGRRPPRLRCRFLGVKDACNNQQYIRATPLNSFMPHPTSSTHASALPSSNNHFLIQSSINTTSQSSMNTWLGSALSRAVPRCPHPAPDSPVVSVTPGTDVPKMAIGVGAMALIPGVADTSAAPPTGSALPRG